LSPNIIDRVDDFFCFFRNCFFVSWFSDQNGIIPIICEERGFPSG
jgi:hypothetical protein